MICSIPAIIRCTWKRLQGVYTADYSYDSGSLCAHNIRHAADQMSTKLWPVKLAGMASWRSRWSATASPPFGDDFVRSRNGLEIRKPVC